MKYIWVRMSETGAKETKDAIQGVASAANDVPERLTIRSSVDGFAKSLAELGALRDAAREAGVRITSARIGLSEAERVASGDGGGGGGGFFSRIFNVLKKIGGFSIGPVPVGAIGLGLAAAPALGSIFGGTMGIIPLLAAATAGVGSFAALAFPAFSQVAGAIGLTGDKLKDLPPGLRGAVTAVQGVMSTFTGLAKVIGPQAFPIIKDLAPGIKQLIGDMGPFAHAVAPVLDQLAKNFSKFTMSSGFKAFLDEMLKLSPGAVAAIGEGIGKIAIAVGKLLLLLVNPHALTYLKDLFKALAAIVQGTGDLIHFLAAAGTAFGRFADPHILGFAANVAGQFKILAGWAVTLGHVAVDLYHAWFAMWHGIEAVVTAAGTVIGDILSGKIPQAGAKLLSWFAELPGKITGYLSSLPGKLFSLGALAVQGLINGINSMSGGVIGAIAHIGSLVTGLGGLLGIHSPSTVMMKIGEDAIEGLIIGMQSRQARLQSLVHDLGVQIGDKLMDAFMSRNDKLSDRAGNQIAAILKARLEQIRSYIIGIAQQQVQWASIISAATGPAFATFTRGTAGTSVFSHTGGPVTTGGTPGSGTAPPTGQQLLRNLRLDLGRLKAFAHVMAKLRRMGLDPVLWQQILAAGPDQGYQIAEAILDAGRGEIRALNATEQQIYQTGIGLGRTAAKVQYGAGIQYVINFNGFIAGNPRAIAREIQKLLADLKRHNGGGALGLT